MLANAVAGGTNGSVVWAGTLALAGPPYRELVVGRLTPAGRLDSAWGSDGLVGPANSPLR